MRHQSSSSQTTLDGEVFDLGPRAGAFGLVAPVLFVAGLLVPADPIRTLFLASGLFALLAYDARPQRRGRPSRIVCKPGVVAIPGLRIRARDLLGATTARHGDRVSLMLAHKKRRSRPIILDLPDEAALITVCRALGIGHHGFGFIDVAVAPPPFTWIRSLLAAFLAPLVLVLLATGAEALQAIVTLGLGAWLLAVLASWSAYIKSVRLTNGGAFLPSAQWGPAFCGFDRMEAVRAQGGALRVTTRPNGLLPNAAPSPVALQTSRWNRFAPSASEIAHLESQLNAAIERAHGHAAPAPAPEAFATVLERAPGESLREWLARVDTIAVGTPGYRSTAAASPKELWEVLEDPNATPDVRAAAARMLKRVAPDELRVRVADVLSTVRDERARIRIAASIDEDALAKEEQLELAEARES